MDSPLYPPSPATITLALFSHFLKRYPPIIQNVYASRIRGAPKQAPALDDDAWRYGELVELVAERKEKTKGSAFITKPELERLVRWKITHGINRPFLPSLIRQNNPELVETATASAFAAHIQQSTTQGADSPFPDEALKHLITLKGVGPATATLVLSICDPVTVPFFEDELCEWICGAKVKLKYDMKEYKGLFGGVVDVRKRLGIDRVRADEVERVAFVCGHLDVLDVVGRGEVRRMLENGTVDPEQQDEEEGGKRLKEQGVDREENRRPVEASLSTDAAITSQTHHGNRPEDHDALEVSEASRKRRKVSKQPVEQAGSRRLPERSSNRIKR